MNPFSDITSASPDETHNQQARRERRSITPSARINRLRFSMTHPFAPVFDEYSHLLVLGSFPSPRSRENGFYYGHPQNRFWPVLAAVFAEELPRTNEEKRAFVLKHGIALWDVLASCTITGAADSSIREERSNDLTPLIKAGIKHIYTTGKTAHLLYNKHCLSLTGIEAVYLPSTSPANRAHWPLEKLIKAYTVLAESTPPTLASKY